MIQPRYPLVAALYLDSSVLVALAFGEPAAARLSPLVGAAMMLVTSRLTRVECWRALHRAQATGRMPADRAQVVADRLAELLATCDEYDLSPPILEQAAMAFPADPVRTLDALHIATALELRSRLAPLHLVTMDDRMRQSARAFGFPVHPT